MIKNMLFAKHNNILGINKRNLHYVYPSENRKFFKIADEKSLSKELFASAGIPHPRTICLMKDFRDVVFLNHNLGKFDNSVIKPNKGRGGYGILVLDKADISGIYDIDQNLLGIKQIKKHCADIIMGVYSYGNHDMVLFEERLFPHLFLRNIYPKGLADFRFILYQQRPVMGMLRLPTAKSHGKANLHQGGIGVGIDLDTGITSYAVYKSRYIEKHPDSQTPLNKLKIPYLSEMIDYCIKVSRLLPLQYIGFDFTLDENQGPMLLEINARPGLEIQKANKKGLLGVL
jgi:alpha-L-glutamate ligase-like protein